MGPAAGALADDRHRRYCINGMFHEVSVMAMMNLTLFFLAGITAGLRPLAERTPATDGHSEHSG